jgi:hypothetical protein
MVLGLLGCDDGPAAGPGDGMERTFTFEDGRNDWDGDFAEYSEEMRDGMDFVFARREVSGLQANTTHEVIYRLAVASDAPSGCAGIGGAPGEAVVMKVGVSTTRPASVQDGTDIAFNLDKDNQNNVNTPATSVLEVGHIANGIQQCTGDVPYQMITFSNENDPLQMTTDEDGRLWLFVGTDSGFEDRTGLYYDTIEVSILS